MKTPLYFIWFSVHPSACKCKKCGGNEYFTEQKEHYVLANSTIHIYFTLLFC